MKLNKHREDIRIMREWASHGAAPVYEQIAARYYRLILMTEAYFNQNQSYFDRKDHVLKEAEAIKGERK